MKDAALLADVVGGFQKLIDDAPSLVDRYFRIYALDAAVKKDEDGAEIKRVLKKLMRLAEQDEARKGAK
jgi:hypothetical protein